MPQNFSDLEVYRDLNEYAEELFNEYLGEL